MSGERLGEAVLELRTDSKGLDSGIAAGKRSAEALQATFERVGKKIQTVGRTMTRTFTLAIAGIGVAIIKSTADMEMLHASFKTMLGTAERATAMMGNLTAMAAKTPYQLTDLAKNTQVMLSFGIATEKVLPTLKQLGDIALGDKEKMSSLTLAFSQIQSAGRLMGQDLLQLINAGFNPLQIIAEQTGETMAELKKRMEKGAISAEEIADAFKIATSEGGRFFGGMETASQTLAGLWSTLRDTLAEMGRSFGNLMLPEIKAIITNITEFAKKLQALNDKQKKAILIIGGIVAALGPLIIIIGAVVTAIGSIIAAPIIAGVIAVTAAITGLALAFGLLRDDTKWMREKSELLGEALWGLGGFVEQVEDAFADLSEQTYMTMQDFDALASKFGVSKEELKEYINENYDLDNAWNVLDESLQTFLTTLTEADEKTKVVEKDYQKLADTIRDETTAALAKVGNTFKFVGTEEDILKGKIYVLTEALKRMGQEGFGRGGATVELFTGLLADAQKALEDLSTVSWKDDFTNAIANAADVVEVLNKNLEETADKLTGLAILKDFGGALLGKQYDKEGNQTGATTELGQGSFNRQQGTTGGGSGFMDILSRMAGAFGPMISSLSSVNALLNPLTTILGGIMEVLGPIIDSLLEPLVGILKMFGMIIGQTIAPLLEALAPIIELVVGVFKVLMTVISPLTTAMQWFYDCIKVTIHNIAEWVKHIFNKSKRDTWEYASYGDMLRENVGAIWDTDYADLGSTTGTTGTTGTAAQYSQVRPIQNTFYIEDNNFNGAGGLQEFVILLDETWHNANRLGLV